MHVRGRWRSDLLSGLVAIAVLVPLVGAVPAGAAAPARTYLLDGAVEVAVGQDHACARMAGGTVECWGSNDRFQLGTGPGPSRLYAAPVPGITSARQVAISGGWDGTLDGFLHTCALLSSGTVKCWGDNTYGQLGDGTTVDRATPVTVKDLPAATAITAGHGYTCAVMTNGTVRCWGLRWSGRLGDGVDEGTSTSPVTVTDLDGVTSVSAGIAHTCALRQDGTVACWGQNPFGGIGDGSVTDRATPVEVAVPGEVSDVAAGREHTCASTGDGRVYCWGQNLEAQLGDGTRTERHAPTRVPGLSTAVDVEVGDWHSCASAANGSVHCWGMNLRRQIGDGTTVDRLTPERVKGVGAALHLDAGVVSSCIVESRGRVDDTGVVVCWGLDSDPQPRLAPYDGATLALPAVGRTVTFVDVPVRSYFHRPVEWLLQRNVTTGCRPDAFCSHEPVTRAQTATFLWRLSGEPRVPVAAPFSDVPADSYFATATRWMRAVGMSTGVGGTNRYDPGAPTTRAQFVTLLHRMVGDVGLPLGHGFVDVPRGAYYENAVVWAEWTGVTTGVGGSNRFEPHRAVTRAEAAAFLVRFAEFHGGVPAVGG